MILASQSPRRIELMREAGFAVTVTPAYVEETPLDGEDAACLVSRLAQLKAQTVAQTAARPQETVIGADTLVVLDDTVLGKPQDDEDARRMLRALSGRTHQVMTGVHFCRLAQDGITLRNMSFVSVTDVTFYELDDERIDAYVASGEAFDKAGAYSIQGEGGRLLVREIEGDFYNVVGLPIAELVRNLELFENLCMRLENPTDQTDATQTDRAATDENEDTAQRTLEDDALSESAPDSQRRDEAAAVSAEDTVQQPALSADATQSVPLEDLDPTIAQ